MFQLGVGGRLWAELIAASLTDLNDNRCAEGIRSLLESHRVPGGARGNPSPRAGRRTLREGEQVYGPIISYSAIPHPKSSENCHVLGKRSTDLFGDRTYLNSFITLFH